MNPAEEIVKFWLQEKRGYFMQSSIRLPKNKEIDILAIDTKTDERFHVEVSVSVRCANYDKNAEDFATKYFFDRKFNSIKEDVEKRLGMNYKKILVVGKIYLGNNDIFEEFNHVCKKLNIEVITFHQILNEVRPLLGTNSHLNPIIKAVQLTEVFYRQPQVKNN